MQINKILCPTDFSRPADMAFEYADFLAKLHAADLVLLHVVDLPEGHPFSEIFALTSSDAIEQLEKRTREDLQDLMNRVDKSVNAAVAVRRGKAWVEICKAMEEEQADMIVLGSHGRTGLSHVLLGSVAEKVLRHASCPVLVVRNPAI
jgi:universal stress protein A